MLLVERATLFHPTKAWRGKRSQREDPVKGIAGVAGRRSASETPSEGNVGWKSAASSTRRLRKRNACFWWKALRFSTLPKLGAASGRSARILSQASPAPSSRTRHAKRRECRVEKRSVFHQAFAQTERMLLVEGATLFHPTKAWRGERPLPAYGRSARILSNASQAPRHASATSPSLRTFAFNACMNKRQRGPGPSASGRR